MPGAHIREHLRIVIFFPTDPSTQDSLTILSRLRSEEPLMSLGVFGPVSTLAKRSIPDFLNDLCSSLLCTHEVCVDVGNGRRLAEALDELPRRAGEPVRPLVAALVASERYGAPLSAGLERLADEVRRDRRRKAEEAARRIPVKLLFPLVGCTLPAFALLTVAPLIAGAVRSLHL